MEKLLARLERRFGRFAIPQLAYIVAGGMGLVFLLSFVRPQFEPMLMLDPEAIVSRREVWRVVSWLFVPPTASAFILPGPIWKAFGIYMVWLFGSSLEAEWGSFKFNVFYMIGMAGTLAAAFITGSMMANAWLNMSCFLAFATLYPDMEFRLFFILPVKVKWLGMLSALGLVWALITGSWGTRIAVTVSFLNYALFFAGHWAYYFKTRNLKVRQAARRASMVEPAKPTGGRVCAICGASEGDGADIRVCSCEKCVTPRTLCLEHARNH